jgi:hypothetical protein
LNKIGFHIILLTLILSCQSDIERDENDTIVASVGTKHLYKSNLAELYPSNASQSDSQNIKNNFLDNWIRENILLQEAEKYIANEINIDKLVKDYRSSLLIYNYEERLVKERLDTFITTDQKLEVYEANKASYLLVSPIVKGLLVQVPADNPEIEEFKKAWIKQDINVIQAYTKKYQLSNMIFPETWVTFADFSNGVSEDIFSFSKIKSKKALDREKDGIQYFVKVSDYRDKNKEAPLEYIEDKIEKVILYNRKVTLLKTIKEKLYERDLENKKVKIYD